MCVLCCFFFLFFFSIKLHMLKTWLFFSKLALMSRIECKYCLISTLCLAGLSDIFILLHIWHNYMYFGVFSPIRTPCDGYHKEFVILCILVSFHQWEHLVMVITRNLNLISVQSWTYLKVGTILTVSIAMKGWFLFAPIYFNLNQLMSEQQTSNLKSQLYVCGKWGSKGL